MHNLAVFTGTANPQLAQDICNYIESPLRRGVVAHFPDGETMVKVEDDVRGKDCFIVQPTSPPVNIHVTDKRRINGEDAEALKLIGDVKDKHVLIFDDMISTAGTINSAAIMANEHGANKITVFATHGLFTGKARERLINSKIDDIYVTDTVPLNKNIKEMDSPGVKVVSVAKLLGKAILRIYQKRSVSILLESNYEDRM